MSIHEAHFITISCDAPECQNTATFEANQEAQKEAVNQNPWLSTHRAVQTWDGRKLGYCSDECEANGIGTGAHNQKKVIVQGTADSVALAARAAQQAHAATQQLKRGGPITLS